MCEQEKIAFDINTKDVELQTMDLLIQAMDFFEGNVSGLMKNDVVYIKERMAKWLYDRYKDEV